MNQNLEHSRNFEADMNINSSNAHDLKKYGFVRNPSLDLIKCIAIWCVLSVHFFLNCGFYKEPLDNKHMLLMETMRTCFMIGVSLFIMATGYLMNGAKLSRRYYKGIISVLEMYFIASIVCILFKKFYLGQDIRLLDGALSILDFSGNSYAWYVEMYIGLFLLIPFLNLIYHGLDSRKKKLALVATMIFLTALPSLANIYNFQTADFWLKPEAGTEYNKLLPSWWTGIYPITYYFLGAYLSEYKIRMNRFVNIAAFIGCVTLFGIFNYYRNYPDPFVWSPAVKEGGFENVVNAFLLFLFCVNLDLNRLPQIVKSVLAKISILSFGIYMMSNVSDGYLYPKLIDAVPEVEYRVAYYFVIVPVSFILAMIMSQSATWLLKLIHRIIDRISFS